MENKIEWGEQSYFTDITIIDTTTVDCSKTETLTK